MPTTPGMDINAVIYQYTAVKDPADSMLVHIQNENADGTGYIFRETDDWSGKPGGSINKLISINNVPVSDFGNGSIQVEGTGQVVNPSVVYSYRLAEIPEAEVPIATPPVIDVYDVMDDEAVLIATKETDSEQYEEQEQEETEEDRKLKAISAAANAVALAGQASLQAMNAVTNMNSYYAANIPGGQYKDAAVLVDTKLPENKRGLRNGLAQQILHDQMVNSQY